MSITPAIAHVYMRRPFSQQQYERIHWFGNEIVDGKNVYTLDAIEVNENRLSIEKKSEVPLPGRTSYFIYQLDDVLQDRQLVSWIWKTVMMDRKDLILPKDLFHYLTFRAIEPIGPSKVGQSDLERCWLSVRRLAEALYTIRSRTDYRMDAFEIIYGLMMIEFTLPTVPTPVTNKETQTTSA
jgi:hypothetical protein